MPDFPNPMSEEVACAQTSSSDASVHDEKADGEDIVRGERSARAKKADDVSFECSTNDAPSDVVPDGGICEASVEPKCDPPPESHRAARILQHRRPRDGRGKRKRGGDTTDEDLLSEFKNSPHHLRITASSVSALCGLHPFQSLPNLLFDLVYQSHLGQMLLQNDARALGLTLVDARKHERETMLTLASTASAETRELVEKVLEVSAGTRKLQSIDEVRSIQSRIKSRAIEAQKDGKLSARQVEGLLEASRGHVSTGFGTCHEDEALDAYESKFGCRVRERNEALMEWRFRRVCDVEGELGVSASPMGEAIRRDWKRSNAMTENDDGKVVEQEETVHGVLSFPLALDKENAKPFFRIVGAVDGIRDELYMDSSKPTAGKSQDSALHQDNANNQQIATNIENSFSDGDEDNWTLRPIIVECKHRMNEAKVPPPLYDQIQTCLYCHMYNVEDADLVQVVRRKSKCQEEENDAFLDDTEDEVVGDGNRKARSTTGETNITVTRVSLNDPIYNHNHHWEATLLPRLASFVDAVYNVRKDDGKRFRLLMAQSEDICDDADEESWRLLWEECPWLRHCDTAYAKRRQF
ncbi:hypothetical protein ACHAW5_005497 [Stephanodiscus triporus]|uniref:Uncharacterized protein n=1 Tax=Stephanodiscus triporus TaxID=2934178 RepID=A0ABD3MRV6_9STRA